MSSKLARFLARRAAFVGLPALLFFAGAQGLLSPELNAQRARPRPTPALTPDESVRRSIAIVRVTSVYYNQTMPWLKQASDPYSVAALVVDGKRLLVVADHVRDASLLEVQKFSSYSRSLAEVVRIDPLAGLALLTVKDERFFDDLQPIAFALQDPAPGAAVVAAKIDSAFRVYRETNQIKEVNASTETGVVYLPRLVFRSTEPFNSGVALCGVQLCGFVAFSDRDRRTELIPVSTLAAFLTRARAPEYAGFVSQGFTLGDLADPVQRQYYGAPANKRGALVQRVIPGTSAWGVLQPEDVLFSIDGAPIDEAGFYDDRRLGRQQAQLLLSLKDGRPRTPGEEARLEIFRQGRAQTVTMPLRPYTGRGERIPWRLDGAPPFLVEGGALFLEFSVALAQQLYGTDWDSKALELAQLYRAARFYENGPGDGRIVLFITALPDEATRGYEGLNVAPVIAVEGQRVESVKALREKLLALAASGKKEAALELAGRRIIYLDLANRDAINRRIAGRYSIPALSSEETPQR